MITLPTLIGLLLRWAETALLPGARPFEEASALVMPLDVCERAVRVPPERSKGRAGSAGGFGIVDPQIEDGHLGRRDKHLLAAGFDGIEPDFASGMVDVHVESGPPTYVPDAQTDATVRRGLGADGEERPLSTVAPLLLDQLRVADERGDEAEKHGDDRFVGHGGEDAPRMFDGRTSASERVAMRLMLAIVLGTAIGTSAAFWLELAASRTGRLIAFAATCAASIALLALALG